MNTTSPKVQLLYDLCKTTFSNSGLFSSQSIRNLCSLLGIFHYPPFLFLLWKLCQCLVCLNSAFGFRLIWCFRYRVWLIREMELKKKKMESCDCLKLIHFSSKLDFLKLISELENLGCELMKLLLGLHSGRGELHRNLNLGSLRCEQPSLIIASLCC